MEEPKLPILEYEGGEPPGRLAARRLRWGLLLIGAWVVGVVLVLNPILWHFSDSLGWGIYGTPAAIGNSDTEYGICAAVYIGLFFLTQWLLLLPHGSFGFRVGGAGRSMMWSAIGASFIAVLLSTGLIAMVMDLGFGRWSKEDPHIDLAWIVMGLLWAAWAWVFWRYLRSVDSYTGLTRIFRGLIAGTLLEMLVAAPAHLWVRRTDPDSRDCYCTRGSYTALVFGCTAIFWLFGPGVFLLFLREKRRRKILNKET